MVAAGGTELYQKAQGFSLSLMLDATYAHWSDFIQLQNGVPSHSSTLMSGNRP